MTDRGHFDRNDPPWMKMMRPESRNSKLQPEFRRFFRFPPISKRPEARLNSLQKALDRKLTLDPITGKLVPLESSSEARENAARHAREYAESTREFLDDPSETASAWLERVRFETT